MSIFIRQVLSKIKEIPRGRVTTYALLAQALGRPGAARAVGNALNKNSEIPHIPCHRVVKSDGSLGGYALGINQKVKYLASEGVKVENGKIKDFANKLFHFKEKEHNQAGENGIKTSQKIH
ncbi:MAG: MGMT family protein [Candidatus Falkowbacteria bacterium]